METYTVSFFGHRQLSDPAGIQRRLDKLLYELITRKDYVEFLVGRDGDFDLLAASAVRRAVKRCDLGNTALVLVLPYMKAEYRDNEKELLRFYDEIEICPQSAQAHFRAAITVRNRCMADRSDLVICCVEHKGGGAYSAAEYARSRGTAVVNLAENSI